MPGALYINALQRAMAERSSERLAFVG